MKKKIIELIIVVIFLITLIYESIPSFFVYSSFSFSSMNYTETELKVIVYKRKNLDNLVDNIRIEHNRINGSVEELTINCYKSVYQMRKGAKPFESFVYTLEKQENK